MIVQGIRYNRAIVMFGSLGGPEVILIFIVALIVFGPKRLPEIGRRAGGIVRDLRRATGEFRSNVEREIGFDPVTGLEGARKARRDLLSSVSEPIRDAAAGTIGVVREARLGVVGGMGGESRADDPVPVPSSTAEDEPPSGDERAGAEATGGGPAVGSEPPDGAGSEAGSGDDRDEPAQRRPVRDPGARETPG